MSTVRQVLFLGTALTLAACGGGEMDMAIADALGQTQAPLHQASPGLRVDGDYIVKVKDGADARAVAAVAGTGADCHGHGTHMGGIVGGHHHLRLAWARSTKDTYGDAASSTVDSWLKTNGTALSFGKLLYKGAL